MASKAYIDGGKRKQELILSLVAQGFDTSGSIANHTGLNLQYVSWRMGQFIFGGQLKREKVKPSNSYRYSLKPNTVLTGSNNGV